MPFGVTGSCELLNMGAGSQLRSTARTVNALDTECLQPLASLFSHFEMCRRLLQVAEPLLRPKHHHRDLQLPTFLSVFISTAHLFTAIS